MNKQEKQITEISEQLKKNYSGSAEFLSGINEATYSIVRNVIECLEANKSNIQSGLKDNSVYSFSIKEIFKL